MSQPTLLFTHDAVDARGEIEARGRRVLFTLGARVLVTDLPADETHAVSAASDRPLGALDAEARAWAAAWRSAQALPAPDAGSAVTPGDFACGTSAALARRLRHGSHSLLAGRMALNGRIAVEILIVSGSGALGISPAEEADVRAQALAALAFLQEQHPTGDLTFDVDAVSIGVQAAQCPRGDGDCDDDACEAWLFEAVSRRGMAPSKSGVLSLAERVQATKRTDGAYVAAFTKYAPCWYAYAWEEFRYTVLQFDTSPIRLRDLRRYFAHETAHVFGATDEYASAVGGLPPLPCATPGGALDVPNHNSGLCPFAHVDCMMQLGAPSAVCEFTRWQVGWNNRALASRQAVGHSGGPGGSPFRLAFAGDARIVGLEFRTGRYVDSITLVAQAPAGRFTLTIGGPGGSPAPALELDPDEHVVRLEGRCGVYVDSLTVVTNKRSHTVGGSGGPLAFAYDVPHDRELIGLVGRSGVYVDALGLITKPSMPRLSSDNLRLGPSGGRHGSPFDDVRPGARISAIRVRHGVRIDAIGLTYEDRSGGTPIDGPMHGGTGGGLEVFDLAADEFVVGLAGRSHDRVDSLIIQTNKRFSKRFGGDGGDQSFAHVLWPGYELAGLFGHSGAELDAIGGVFARRP